MIRAILPALRDLWRFSVIIWMIEPGEIAYFQKPRILITPRSPMGCMYPDRQAGELERQVTCDSFEMIYIYVDSYVDIYVDRYICSPGL